MRSPLENKGWGSEIYPLPPAADGLRGKLEGTSLPSDGSKGKREEFTPSVLRTLLRGDGFEGKIQRTFLREEGVLLPKQGPMLPNEGLVLPEEGAFLPKEETASEGGPRSEVSTHLTRRKMLPTDGSPEKSRIFTPKVFYLLAQGCVRPKRSEGGRYPG